MGTPDLYDAATNLEELERERILKAHADRPREAPLVIKGVRLCVDCQDKIDKQRIVVVPDCVRCFECQHYDDKKRGLR